MYVKTTPTLGSIINQRSSHPVANTGLGDVVMVTENNKQGSAFKPLLNNKKAGLKNDSPNLCKMEDASQINSSWSPSKPTLGDIINQGSRSRTDMPTSTIPCDSSDPSILIISHKPTLGDIINQGGSSRTDTPTSRSDTSALLHKPTLGDIISCTKTVPASFSPATPTLGDIIGGSTSGDMSGRGYDSAPSLASIIGNTSHTHYNETTTTLSPNKIPSLFDLISPGQTARNSTPGVVKEGVSLSGRGPPGFSSGPLVADPFSLARQITMETSRSHGNESPEDRVSVSVSIVPPLMVGVVLAGNHGDRWVDSEVLDERKELVMRKIRKRIFSRKQFSFSTPSPDDFALERQRKGFRGF